jgi:hypothetical protein
MKNPVLHVKKGAEIYDDAREESERPQSVSEATSRNRSLRGRRRAAGARGRLTFLPLLILALALVFVFRFVRAPTNQGRVAGWQAVLRAEPYGSELLVGVTFSGTTRTAGVPEKSPRLVLVRFVLPDTGEQKSVAEYLVRSPMTIRAQLHDSPAVRKVQADVSIGSEKRILTLGRRSRR